KSTRLYSLSSEEPSVLCAGCVRPGRVVFSPDGKLLAVFQPDPVSWHRGIHLYDSQSGKKLRYFGEGDLSLRDLAFSADGKSLATEHPWRPRGPRDLKITQITRRLWDVRTGKERGTFFGDYFTLATALAQSGEREAERAPGTFIARRGPGGTTLLFPL